MANLKEFNFRHQTAAQPLASACLGLQELLNSRKEEEEENHLRGGRWLKNFQAEQPIDSQGDAC